ncbi:MAG: hypothetical protein IKE74_03760 [Mogibacterium sp.]|nr:hypothetical protein [Mogibacterium sp.]
MKILIVLIIALLLLPKGSDKGTKKGKSSRPWYDISYDDMIEYDLFDDED